MGSGGLPPALVRTVRALALVDKPIPARNLAGSFRFEPTIAALRWLRTYGYVGSGTSHTGGHRHEPVYWLTNEGTELHRQLTSGHAGGPRI